jgi:hypothetical protein
MPFFHPVSDLDLARRAQERNPADLPEVDPDRILRRRSFHFFCFVAQVKIGGIALRDFIQLNVSWVGPGGMPDLGGENAGPNLALRGFFLEMKAR